MPRGSVVGEGALEIEAGRWSTAINGRHERADDRDPETEEPIAGLWANETVATGDQAPHRRRRRCIASR